MPHKFVVTSLPPPSVTRPPWLFSLRSFSFAPSALSKSSSHTNQFASGLHCDRMWIFLTRKVEKKRNFVKEQKNIFTDFKFGTKTFCELLVESENKSQTLRWWRWNRWTLRTWTSTPPRQTITTWDQSRWSKFTSKSRKKGDKMMNNVYWRWLRTMAVCLIHRPDRKWFTYTNVRPEHAKIITCCSVNGH